MDVETIAALRRRWLSGTISDQRLQAAADYLLDLPVTRYPTLPFMKRVIALRANVSAYDACYVALAEILDCPLLTGDKRLANAPGVRCKFKLITEH
ncbi:type II toxin-antitoxin system VapC family toxin [Arthrobacter sp. H5]|uniref:type II toxin-antitoxin system VapC family toxin n=1 Tax=Arthrobacter sp. H5 TaxID=1267973 RepID=UPI0004B75F78